jgi:hypothetical protein
MRRHIERFALEHGQQSQVERPKKREVSNIEDFILQKSYLHKGFAIITGPLLEPAPFGKPS